MKINLIKRSNIVIFVCCLMACNNTDSKYTNNKYFIYNISTVKIADPRIVLFKGNEDGYGSLMNPLLNFVCPDSAVRFCSEQGWINREDVFLLNFRSFEVGAERSLEAPSYWFNKCMPWDRGFLPWRDLEVFNDTIRVGRFFYDEDLSFVLSMIPTSYYWYDPRRPKNVPMSDRWDNCDAVRYSNTYRLAVRPNYSIWQTVKIRKMRFQGANERYVEGRGELNSVDLDDLSVEATGDLGTGEGTDVGGLEIGDTLRGLDE